MKLLLLSNSTNNGRGYLEHAWPAVEKILNGISDLLFVPYASAHHDLYTETVRNAFSTHKVAVTGLHEFSDKTKAIHEAQAVFIGGGNTFRLLTALQNNNLIGALRNLAISGRPYIGASAGTNIAAPTLQTTNDMPIVQPANFDALGLVPFQINCHYLDADPHTTHAGETRELRLREYLEDNKTPVLALREGTYLLVESSRSDGATRDGELSANIGGNAVDASKGPAVLFRRNYEATEIMGNVSELFVSNASAA